MSHKNYLYNLACQESQRRVKISNNDNGRAYMSCVIVGKNNKYLLRKRDKSLQYR